MTAAAVQSDQFELTIPLATMKPKFEPIPWILIDPDPDQPRKDADADLAAAIAANGLLQPITVRPHPVVDGRYMVIYGERRWRSCEHVLPEVPCIVRRDLEERLPRLKAQFVENSAKQLAPMEQAHALDELLREPGATLASVARATGLARSTVQDRVALLQLGPWTPLIESGDVASSFAVRALGRVASCPDSVHEAAVAAFVKRFPNRDSAQRMIFETFEAFVREQYRPKSHPLTKIKGSFDNPAFDTKAHDAECECGRIRWTEYGHKDREFCGNPGWWKPLEKTANKAAKEKEAAARGPSSNGATPSSRPRITLHMPNGCGMASGSPHGDAPKGTAWLTDTEGRWATGYDYDPRVAAGNTVPAALTLVKTTLGDRAAVDVKIAEAATKEWNKRWTARREALVAERVKTMETKAFIAVNELGQDALAILLADAWDLEYYDDWDFKGSAVLVELATLIKVPRPPKDNDRGHNPMPKWVEGAGATIARRLLRAWLFARREEWPSIDDAIDGEVHGAMDEIAKAKVPWLKAPKGGKAKADKPVAPWDHDDEDPDAEGDDA